MIVSQSVNLPEIIELHTYRGGCYGSKLNLDGTTKRQLRRNVKNTDTNLKGLWSNLRAFEQKIKIVINYKQMKKYRNP